MALLVAHTNADVADPGVSDALAGALGLTDLSPLRPSAADALDKLVTFVPEADADGSSTRWPRPAPVGSATTSAAPSPRPAPGRSRPLPGASPAVGEVGAP